MRMRGDKRTSRKHDRKVLVAEESTKSWADTDSESSSSSSSSSDSEQEEVHCLMADQTSDDEVFDFSNFEFTREDLVSALNDMVKEYMKLSHTFEEVKAKNIDLKNSSAEPSVVELGEADSLKIELSKLTAENELLREESNVGEQPVQTDEDMAAERTVGTDGMQTQSYQTDYFVEEPDEEMYTEAVEQSADEDMSLEDILMTIPVDVPLHSAGMEISKITLGQSIKIPGVDERTWYLASLPKIKPKEKGKKPL
ncbi:hypothetical protein F511_41402 [Dorcoceras hygrometricum]|uniref:Uncharacterized protein n=1 Tax=Dorcoceras hygrometricum TaxID=472368 RepID=A0A2Z7BE41_9LAMI|nr:hypothetical protein F511_41402 [Dorcoceras hygrometricum]